MLMNEFPPIEITNAKIHAGLESLHIDYSRVSDQCQQMYEALTIRSQQIETGFYSRFWLYRIR